MAGKNNRKFGRHSRNTSSKLQAQRTEKNKRIRLERETERNINAGMNTNTNRQQRQQLPMERIMYTGLVPDMRVWGYDREGARIIKAMPKLRIVDGVTVDVLNARP